MKVILIQEVEGLGKAFETKEVNDGYARNFLFPKKLVRDFSSANEKWAQEQQAKQEAEAAEALKEVAKMAGKIDGLEIEMPVKIGDKGQLFEKVNSQKIASKLQDMGYDIKKTQVDLAGDIKELGEFEAKIKFDHGLEANVKLIIVAE
ncbi:MAG: 50S ribosomal protein L9 [Patescibacteria group bacterium]|nr:50S ribosomal protein L9 [Patescibacteria group bacterium]